MKEPVWLTAALVRVMQSEFITQHGGELGRRNEGLLESALKRARMAWSYDESDLCVLAARYGHGLSSNHTFVDGNKRVALVAIEEDAYLTIMELAGGQIDADELAVWIRANAATLD